MVSSNLKLSDTHRHLLKHPLGILLRGSTSEVWRKLNLLFKLCNPSPIISVGDYTSLFLHEQGVPVNLYIVNGKVMRKKVKTFKNFHFHISNPPGTISAASWSAIRAALKSGRGCILKVDGEEDLLTLPAILLSPVGGCVIYGQPKEGKVYVPIFPRTKAYVARIVASLKRVK
ncbi:hypothetical protein B6U74_00770 [Candidatus Bathyarchaeota archaeon ex4484_205]|nr:MAG: hypothetical protein B6U74_00770 [Candidatus Bathyarchaeota archaeon ex4484_205]RLG67499.1 MAG: hypothetical protein DRN93_04450 [archaeon]